MTDTSAEFFNAYVDKLKKKYDDQSSANLILEVRLDIATKLLEEANARAASAAEDAAQKQVRIETLERSYESCSDALKITEQHFKSSQDTIVVLNAETDRNMDYVGNLKLEIERLRRDCEKLGGELHASKKMIDDLLAQAAQTRIKKKKTEVA